VWQKCHGFENLSQKDPNRVEEGAEDRLTVPCPLISGGYFVDVPYRAIL
jgi:hypothetical protein